ncbi:hypothetical protein GCM10008018_39180 [Paenibacillus marchantiophytorum]|uniref:Fibronectin type-III domain-containing protein n=1 Tax=Paenibacillus marchantiophytorum TaxID=1619310 RepID=A0ABQ1EVH8_9BACL|nr:hypothetical protein GCM10008018_39180 [Paenibacillus marchantiophytorum]
MNKVYHRMLTSFATTSTLMRKRWKAGLARLLIAALLLQCLPLIGGGLSTAQANGTVTEQTYGSGAGRFTVQSNTYAPASKLTDYTWSRVTLNLSPDARQAASMIYDEQAGNVVMFGGQGNSGLLDDTWIWDGSEKKWQEMLNRSPKPLKRKGAVMAFDAVSQKVLLFGGEGQSGVLGDTWLWDGIDAKWEQVTGLAASPSARGGAQLAFDGEHLVLFGGYTGSGNSKTPLGDTWIWDGAAWAEAQPTVSPPAAYSGQMAYDGHRAVLYGGDSGAITASYESTSTHEIKSITHDDSSPLLWKWDRDAQTWTSTDGPESYGRWGQSMAYDGRRVVFFSGERDYIHMYYPVLVDNLKLPSTTYPTMAGSMAYGWTGSAWEKLPRTVSMETAYQSDTDGTGKVFSVQRVPNQLPFPISYANMAFDGKNFVVFGGNRSEIKIMDKVFGSVVGSMPAGNMKETWVFGYTPPSAPGIKMTVDPILNFDPQHTHDTVSVISNVYDDGTRTVKSRGVEYRLFTETGDAAWIQVPYTKTGTEPEETSSFTVQLEGLTWHQKYEVRGYAVNEIGRGYTDTKSFEMKNDPNMKEPDVDYDRVGASVLHVKDKKRLVAVGTGVPNLLRKPLDNIHYFLQSQSGTQYKLNYNVLNERQLELTWKDELPPGKYDVHLEHDFYNDYVFPEGLLITALDFYKPRSFARVEVPSSSASNEVNSLVLQGPFTEDPSAANVYVLNDTSEPVMINDSVMFKGSRLVVDKTTAKATISGEGRLYVNGGGALGSNLSYTLQDGPFTISSDNFSLALRTSEATDYLNIDMPVKASSFIFTKDGLRLTGNLQIGMQVGDQKVSDSVSVEALNYRNNRFDLSGTFVMNKSFKVGPFQVKDSKFVVDSRIPYMSVRGTGSLPDTDLSFDLSMKTKQGRLDGVNFGMYQKVKLASTGLQVNYLFGNVEKLAEKTQVPQKFNVTGSVNDVIVPELKHPQVNYKFNLLGTDSVDMDVSSYGFNASGIEYYYWLPVKNMNIQTVVNPTAAGIKGFTAPGFAAKGDINVFDVVKGAIGTYSFNKKGFDGVIKGTVYVPKGIPRIGGATVNNVALTVNEKGISGTFRHNGVGANLKYTFNNNTILFEVEAEPPPKKWWEKGLDFINNVSDFMDAAEPWLDIAEELFLMKPASKQEVSIAASNPLKRVFDLKPISLSFQPDESAQKDGKARIVDGQLTTIDRTPMISTEATSGTSTTSFALDRSYEALIALSGDQRAAVLKGAPPGQQYEQTVRSEMFYDAENATTFMRATLNAGNLKLATNGSSHISINELVFANESLKLAELVGHWTKAPERSVTSLVMKERGSYVLRVGEAQGEVIVYKPDGRPYSLQTNASKPDWNAFRDGNGQLYVLLDAVEAGTWMISAGTSPTAALNSVSPETTISDVRQWGQSQAYPNVFEMSGTDNGQAIVEIYGADAQTKLYQPSGELYTLQLNPNQPGMNAIYDEGQHKLTILLNEVELKGQWKAVARSYTSVVAYKSTRKFKSIKPLLMEGRFSKFFQLPQKGDYMLAVSGGDANTIITAPDGTPYKLNFETPNGNAYLQPASDRMATLNPPGDPLDQTKIDTPTPALDGRDMLYVSLLGVSAGKWTIQSTKKVDVQIQKLIAQSAMKASVSPVSGVENRIQVTWSLENTAPDTTVTVSLTDSADQTIGEVIAEGLSTAGQTTIDLPASMQPGTYYLSVASAGANIVPVYAVAETTVEVTAPYTLNTPAQPEVISTGNGEVSLRFASLAGDVTAYRIWARQADKGQAAVPVWEMVPVPGNLQQAIVTGLTAGASYTFAVSAVGQEQGRLAVSPQSASVTAELPVPQQANLTLKLDAGAQAVTESEYTAYDGNKEKLLLTAAEQASLQVTADQAATLTLSVNGQQVDTQQVSAGGTYAFALQDLLHVSVLKEREYNLLIEAINERGDRSLVYRKLFVDRTGPMLIASGGNDAQGKPISLNGTVTDDSKVYITGQTDAGAKLVINGTNVPLSVEGRFVYYVPLVWGAQTDRNQVTLTATDQIGNKTEYGFEVLRGIVGTLPTYPSDLATLATGNAKMSAPYVFGQTAYQASAYADKVRVYAVPMDASSVVKVDGQTLQDTGYVDVAVPAAGRTVAVSVHPTAGADKQYSLQVGGTGSNVALLNTLKLNNATAAQAGEVLPAQTFTGAEDSYAVYVDNTINSVTLTPGALMAGSSIQVKGQSVQSGLASQTIQLQVGENQIPVTVSSPDRAETRSYQVRVMREQSGNAQLQSLGLATDGAQLVSAFKPTTMSYQVLVPYATAAFKLLPVAEQSDAVIRLDGQAVTNGNIVSIPLAKDAQTYAIEVRAQDGTTLTYSVSVLRQQTLPVQPPLLASLEVSTVLDSEFNPYKLNYGSKGKTTNNSVLVIAKANDPLAIVTIDGVSLKGGGSFGPNLNLGENTILVSVESVDLKSSQMYAIGVVRLDDSSEPPPKVRDTTITGSNGGWTFQTSIVRTTSTDGKILDTVRLNELNARTILEKAEQNKDKVARIYVTDLPDAPADERIVSLSAESLKLLADGAMSLELMLPDAKLVLSAESLQQMSRDGKDAYFRVVPIRAAEERSEVASRVKAAELVLKAAGGQPIAVIGQPVKIETNYTGYKTEILFPLDNLKLPANKAAAKRMLAELAVYIEHSDGDKELAQGEIRYDAEGKAGIAIQVSKFSTFTIIQKNAQQVLKPYLSGYPDGTFRPSQAITRAELATILHRVGVEGAEGTGLAAGYPDVAQGHWAMEAIAHMQRSGVMLGDNNGLFRPEDSVTRGEIASIAARLAGTAADGSAQTGDYSDTQGHWAAEAIRQASKMGILQGYPDGTFQPDNRLNRAEAVQVLNRLFGRPTAVVQASSWPDVHQDHWALKEIESASGSVELLPGGRVKIVPNHE